MDRVVLYQVGLEIATGASCVGRSVKLRGYH